MKFIEKEVDYLKNNPKGYWFRRKRIGWGWTPATREGWFVTLLYGLGIVGLVKLREDEMSLMIENPFEFFAPFVALTVLLFVIIWRTGEPQKWKWDKK